MSRLGNAYLVHNLCRFLRENMARVGNAYLVHNLWRFLRENMARVDKERELSRFICIFAQGGHLQNGRLKVAGPGQGTTEN